MQIRELDTLLYGALSSVSLLLLGFYLENVHLLIASVTVFGLSYLTSLLRNYIADDYDAFIAHSVTHTVLHILTVSVWVSGFLIAILDLSTFN